MNQNQLHTPQAFPTLEMHPHGLDLTDPGMTLRDYFAAKALPAVYAEACKEMDITGYPPDWRKHVAFDAFSLADAMLETRRTPTGANHE